MTSKNIVFVEKDKAELIDEQCPTLNGNSVVVKLAVSSISSGTERANIIGSDTVGWMTGPTPAVFPRRSGYSSSGVVVEIGEKVKNVKVGDKVAVSWSTHNQYVVTNEANVYPIEDISFEDAALFYIATFPLAAIRKCRLEVGESAIVMGLGILGMLGLNLLKASGAVPIIAVDPDPVKRQKALEVGADFAFDPYDTEFSQKVKKVTNGGANVGIEVTGIGAGLNGILDCMALKGRVALLGCTRNSDFTVDYYRKVHGPGITLVGAHTMARPDVDSSNGWWTDSDDMKALIKLTKFGRIKLSDFVEETYSPNEAPTVYNRLITEKTFPITQFDWRRLECEK